MIRDLIVGFYGEVTYNAIATFFAFYPVWLPPLMLFMVWQLWVRYIRAEFFAKTEMVLLEIKIPKEIFKSPVAMELVLNAMFQTGGEGTVIDRWWQGKVRAWFSLEIAAINGQVRFFIWTRKALRNLVEASIYAQYPEVEIKETADYTKQVVYDKNVNAIWGCNYVLDLPDPLAIKTYVEYGLDRDPKEEFKNDPITAILEFLGSLKPEEQVWLQFVIRAHKKEKRNGFFSKKEDWRTQVDEIRKKIIADVKESGRNTPSKGESEVIESLERNFKKFAFDCGARCVYIAPKEIFSMPGTVVGLRGLLRPFSAGPWNDVGKMPYAGFNSFKMDKGTDFDYPWEDFRGMRLDKKRRKKLDAYKRRMFFFYPYKEKGMILTTEELATVYHFPGQVAATPGLERIPSKRGQAPTNLPI